MKEQTATFAAGCFWSIEASFLSVPGVVNVVSGYTGGHSERPTYEQVCTGTTGHAESVQISFNPEKVSYEKLLSTFLGLHDPTQMNRQGCDVGEQYRSIIFYHSPEQEKSADRILKEFASQFFPKTIATTIEPAQTFWKAEEYHQRYAEKHPDQIVCRI